MFGSRKRQSIKDAIYCCRILVAGIDLFGGKPVPQEAYTDAYVLGFFQQVILHAISFNYGGQKPSALSTVRITANVIDYFWPKHGKFVLHIYSELNKPGHIGYLNYKTGSQEGERYVQAVSENNEAISQPLLLGFRDFIRRHYMK